MRRVGVVIGYAESDPAARAQVAALRGELQKPGWDEGRNIRIQPHRVDGGFDPATVAALVAAMPRGCWGCNFRNLNS